VGGNLSKTNTTQFTIAAGTGIINDLNKESGAAKPIQKLYISWSQQTITCSGLDSGSSIQKNTWIYVDEMVLLINKHQILQMHKKLIKS
jgi:hypothetical protein